jgi:cytochrome c-type biogenesis protein CcmH/NrfF
VPQSSASAPDQGFAPRFDTIVGKPLPGPVAGLFRDILSPYCPGLTLESCPSPQADSLRKAIRSRYEGGEDIQGITVSLREHYGPDVLGKPPVSGLGAAAWLGPVLLVVVGAVAIQRWLRRNQRRATA